MTSHSVHARISPEELRLLDAIRASMPTTPSRNAALGAIIGPALVSYARTHGVSVAGAPAPRVLPRERHDDPAIEVTEEAPPASVAPAGLPDGKGAAGGDGGARLKAIMEERGLKSHEVALAAGLSAASAGTVRAVASGSRPLTGKLRAWVEREEASGS